MGTELDLTLSAIVPIVTAVARSGTVSYAEIVSSIFALDLSAERSSR